MRTTMGWSRRWVVLLAVGLLAGPTAAPSAAAGCEGASLGVGDEVFCAAVNIDRAQVPGEEFCGVAGECPEWPITIAAGGSQLRVALSAVFQEPGDVRAWADFSGSAPESIFRLQILDEDRTVLARGGGRAGPFPAASPASPLVSV